MILTNENMAYFYLGGEIAMQDNKPQVVKIIDRRGIGLCSSRSRSQVDQDDLGSCEIDSDGSKIIQEAKLKGGYTPSKWLEQVHVDIVNSTSGKQYTVKDIPELLRGTIDQIKRLRVKNWWGQLKYLPFAEKEKSLPKAIEDKYNQYRAQIKKSIDKAAEITPISKNPQAFMPLKSEEKQTGKLKTDINVDKTGSRSSVQSSLYGST